MFDRRVQRYNRYLAAWSQVSGEERARMLQESCSVNIVFTNSIQTRHGLADLAAHLKDFQARSPGDSFRMNNLIGWGSYGLAEWQWVSSEGEAGVSGYDVLTFDEQGLISSILLFANVEAQKLSWRGRNPVALKLAE